MSVRTKYIAVVSGNFDQFKKFAQETVEAKGSNSGFKIMSQNTFKCGKNKYIYVPTKIQAMGLNVDSIIMVGTWNLNKDAMDAHQELLRRLKK